MQCPSADRQYSAAIMRHPVCARSAHRNMSFPLTYSSFVPYFTISCLILSFPPFPRLSSRFFFSPLYPLRKHSAPVSRAIRPTDQRCSPWRPRGPTSEPSPTLSEATSRLSEVSALQCSAFLPCPQVLLTILHTASSLQSTVSVHVSV